ncbi:UNVERIFIED_CONTAM: hypothetical protein NY100_34545, partial [Prevotella sp. 15_C9]
MVEEGVAAPAIAVIDFTGMAQAMEVLRLHLDTDSVGIGAMPFDPALPAYTMPQWLWSGSRIARCLLSCVLALLP